MTVKCELEIYDDDEAVKGRTLTLRVESHWNYVGDRVVIVTPRGERLVVLGRDLRRAVDAASR